MLNELPIQRITYNASSKLITVHVAGLNRTQTVAATLLTAQDGSLVGVDVDPDGARMVLMQGAHEAVVGTTATTVRTQPGVVQIAAADRLLSAHALAALARE
jgi:hypothetical protein